MTTTCWLNPLPLPTRPPWPSSLRRCPVSKPCYTTARQECWRREFGLRRNKSHGIDSIWYWFHWYFDFADVIFPAFLSKKHPKRPHWGVCFTACGPHRSCSSSCTATSQGISRGGWAMSWSLVKIQQKGDMFLPLSIFASVLIVFFSIRIKMYLPEGQSGDVIRGGQFLLFVTSLPSKLPGGVFDPGLCSWWVPGLSIHWWQWSERWVAACGDTMKTTLITYHLHWYVDMITLSCVTKASEEFLPCGLHPVAGQQAGEFVRISVCSGHRLFFGGKSRTWQTWIPTSLCRRNNPSDFWPLAMCEAHLFWMFAKALWHGIFRFLILEI